MVNVPLGRQAYNRKYAGEAEIRLVNRYLETNPTNLAEGASLISRPGSISLASFTGGAIRGLFAKVGMFLSDLFVAAGTALYRFNASSGVIPIVGAIANNGFVYMTWMKGIGYSFVFVSDGAKLWFYNTHAMGFLTVNSGGNTITDVDSAGQIIQIGGVYYAWSASVDGGAPAGTAANPYRALLGTAIPDGLGLTGDASSLNNMAMLLNFSGAGGLNYSSAVPGPATVTASAPSSQTPNSDTIVLTVTAIVDLSAGNTISTTIQTGTGVAWGAATLTGGGNQALQQVTGMAAGEVPKALLNLSGSVLVSVGNSQKFYWINPGETTINPLNFAEKESNPDNINSMLTVGDQAMIMGDESTEVWYATGNFDAPFAPVEGRVFKRGVLEGTAVVVGDNVVVVGEDNKVYSIGYSYGADAQYGVHRISTHGIEERIRTQVRRNQGLPS